MKTIILVLFAGLLLSGQTADVQILEASDAGLVWQVYQELTAVQKTWTDLNARIKKKYRAEGEIEYSRDFKAFIQKSKTSATGTVAPYWTPTPYGRGNLDIICTPSGGCTSTLPYITTQ